MLLQTTCDRAEVGCVGDFEPGDESLEERKAPRDTRAALLLLGTYRLAPPVPSGRGSSRDPAVPREVVEECSVDPVT